MIDAASGGVFVDNTPQEERNLIENMAANSQQFGTRNGQTARECGICAKVGHSTDMCPALQEGSTEQVNAAGRFPGPPQRNYDPYSNTYTSGWRDHLNLRYGNPSVNQHAPHVQPNNQAYRETRANIQYLNTQVGQLATTINWLEAQSSSSLPSQTVVNTKDNVSAITLRSGRELKVHNEEVQTPVKNEHEEKSEVKEEEIIQEAPKDKFPPLSEYKPVATFPLALKESRKNEGIKGLYEVFRRCEMADRSIIHPRGVIEDVLVQVDKLIFSADFYVLDMKNNDLNSLTLLGRPFLKTLKSIIDVNNGTLSMEFDGKIVKFHIFDTLKIPGCESVVNNIDINDHLSQEYTKDMNEDKLKEVPRIETKLPPDRAKGIPMEKGKKNQETGIPRKSNQRKQRQKMLE
ncbi:uncharacterized protein [Henckelia pumila]|uniref:uncharacterized protein n=1 Tax=Henckelia pumila TaxID=405737 RepID=UPI003C6E33B1